MARIKHDLCVPLLFSKNNSATVPVLGMSLVPKGDGSLHQTVAVPLSTLDSTLEPTSAGILSIHFPRYARREFYSTWYVHPPQGVNQYVDHFPDGFSHLLAVLLGFYALGADQAMGGTSFRDRLGGWTASSYPDKSGKLLPVGQLKEKLLAIFAENDDMPRKGAEKIHSVLLSEADKQQVAGLLGMETNAIGEEVEITASQLTPGDLDPSDVAPESQYKLRLVFVSSFQGALQVVFGPKLLHAHSKSRMLRVAMLALSLVLVVGVLAWWQFWANQTIKPRETEWEPHTPEIKGSVVTVYSKDGKNCWSIRVDGTIYTAQLAKLFPDQPNHLVVGVSKSKPEAPDKDAGTIRVYDPTGELIWSKPTDEPYPYTGTADNRMSVAKVAVVDLWNDDAPEIVAISHDAGWYPSKISVLDHTGQVIKRYWHPGHLSDFVTFDSSESPRKRIVAWGCNNDMISVQPGAVRGVYFHALVCLDPETMQGEAPPRRGNLGEGSEIWYGLLHPQEARISHMQVVPQQPGDAEGSPGQTIRVAVFTGVSLFIDEYGKCTKSVLHDVTTDKAEITKIELISPPANGSGENPDG